jgi:hypothetical protein
MIPNNTMSFLVSLLEQDNQMIEHRQNDRVSDDDTEKRRGRLPADRDAYTGALLSFWETGGAGARAVKQVPRQTVAAMNAAKTATMAAAA